VRPHDVIQQEIKTEMREAYHLSMPLPAIRRLRKWLDKDKSNQKVNLLWFIFGLAISPCLCWLYEANQRLLPQVLSGAVIILVLLLLILSISLAFLQDRLKVINRYLKDQNITWDAVENDVAYSEAYDEAKKEQEEKQV
jgi:glucan phosphoethanolaminetransferase (alkaline phosphatase superfamily)